MANNTPIIIIPATTSYHLSQIHTLFLTYTSSLNLDLSYQSLNTELSTLPGAYAPPSGRLFLAVSRTGDAIGCVGLRKLPSDDQGTCCDSRPKVAEMKRLYAVPAARGTGVGRCLAEAAIQGARDAGYETVKLDTLGTMHGAMALYRSLGFVECGRYYDTPVDGTRFFELDLRKSSGSRCQ
ncbi:hypothetical protein CAC42_3617 [Sphaceloma murrayae]|uniref:N-acetyltransferase domain-containing protein n=1 Tax=Sphaceloma murrayae TaxID=2082308 RepID=A0A2K1QSZ0_9PEZI|nr:hypothetical protein CAC42_3617 [Sphaceloma murrayae]